MKDYKAFLDYEKLKSVIYDEYEIKVDTIKVIKDYCATVYLLCTTDKKYIFKLYRAFDTEIAIQSTNIMGYLAKKSFSVATVINTRHERPNITLSFPEGDRIGVLFDYIEGTIGYNLDFNSYAEEMGEKLGLMHNIMDEYDRPLIQYGKEHYVGRYINMMKEFNYTPSKIDELEAYGNVLWDNIAKSKTGFCHGDMNESNFIKSSDGKVYIFDFDCAGFAYPINDLFAICCVTESFPCFNITAFQNPNEKLPLLKRGYEKYKKLEEYDISAMHSFIGLNCYWMIAQQNKYKSHLEGRQWLDKNYFDSNYEWLMYWKSQYRR